MTDWHPECGWNLASIPDAIWFSANGRRATAKRKKVDRAGKPKKACACPYCNVPFASVAEYISHYCEGKTKPYMGLEQLRARMTQGQELTVKEEGE